MFIPKTTCLYKLINMEIHLLPWLVKKAQKYSGTIPCLTGLFMLQAIMFNYGEEAGCINLPIPEILFMLKMVTFSSLARVKTVSPSGSLMHTLFLS